MWDSDTFFGSDSQKFGEKNGSDFNVLKAELGFIFASFANTAKPVGMNKKNGERLHNATPYVVCNRL